MKRSRLKIILAMKAPVCMLDAVSDARLIPGWDPAQFVGHDSLVELLPAPSSNCRAQVLMELN